MRGPLPTGTVTFLLTDVEGSTVLWQERATDMPGAIARHYEILDAAIARHHGVRPEEQGEGDSVVGAFDLAANAVAAALDAQRSLADELPWLPVRMALHTGEAQLRDEHNYVGRTIIRCARLRACAHGGQVVASAATAALAADEVEGARFVDLGAVRLRDLGTERVWQVSSDGLRSSFPPLRSSDAVETNLPRPASTFVGRTRELATLAELLRNERLVTLTGSGGAGKSRLALHAASDAAARYRGGTWWVELGAVSDEADVADAVLRAIGASANGDSSYDAVVRSVQSLGQALVVLDNAEHVLDIVADVATALVERCSDVCILVTSREPLGVPGEVVWRVPSLALPPLADVVSLDGIAAYEAAALFLDRARRARPNLPLDDSVVGHVASICHRLDGLPLALELAAARVRTLPLARLAAGLDDAFRLLTGGSRRAIARQQTLLASIAWSFDLLDERERTVLRRLAVFQTAFSLEAAEAVAGDGELVEPYEVFELLSRLVDKSLVQLDDTGDRYRLLETIRQFGLDRLRDADDVSATRARHAEWYATWCESLGRGDHDFDIDDQHPLLADVFTALAWAYETSPTTVCRISYAVAPLRDQLGRYHDFARQAAWFAEHEHEPDPTTWALGVTGLVWMAAAGVAGPDVLPLFMSAAPLLADHPTGAWRLRWLPAVMAGLAGDCGALADILPAARATGDDQAIRRLWGALMVANGCAGRLQEAERHATSYAEMYRRRGLVIDARTAAGTYGFQLHLIGRRGDLRTACQRAREATPSGTSADISTLTSCVAELAHAGGDRALAHQVVRWQHAVEAALDAVGGPDRPGLRSPIAYARGVATLLDGDLDDALDHFRRAQRTTPLAVALNGWVTVPLVHLLLRSDRRDEADELVAAFTTSRDTLDDVPQPETDLHLMRSWLAQADGDLERAMDHAHRSLRAALAADLRVCAVDALHAIAVLSHRRGNVTAAARLLAAVRAEQDRIGMVLRFEDRDLPSEELESIARRDNGTAWEEGAVLRLEEAAELAGRTRGERSRPLTGWASLTPTEERVATLAAAGRSNADIGRQLLMGVPTVKTHLTRVFSKLAITNRTELAAIYRDRP